MYVYIGQQWLSVFITCIIRIYSHQDYRLLLEPNSKPATGIKNKMKITTDDIARLNRFDIDKESFQTGI